MRRWIVLALVAWMLGGCESPPATRVQGEVGGEYRYTRIDGMPCLMWRDGYGNNGVGGITCDWSKWKGE